MGRASRAKARARASASSHTPEAKISATIIDFGLPLLRQLQPTDSEAVHQATFKFIVHAWNAHVLAMPVWNQPEHLAALHATLQGQSRLDEGESFQAYLELTRRRKEPRFVNDCRAVGEWRLRHLPDGGLNLYCDARLPENKPTTNDQSASKSVG